MFKKKKAISLMEVLVSIILLSIIFSLSLNIINKNNKINKINKNNFHLESYISLGKKEVSFIKSYKTAGNYYEVLKSSFQIDDIKVREFLKNKTYKYKQTNNTDKSFTSILISNLKFVNGKSIDKITY